MAGRRTIPMVLKRTDSPVRSVEGLLKIGFKITDGPENLLDRTGTAYMSINEAKKLIEEIKTAAGQVLLSQPPKEKGIYLWEDEEGEKYVLLVEGEDIYDVLGHNNYMGKTDRPEYKRGWIEKLAVNYNP